MALTYDTFTAEQRKFYDSLLLDRALPNIPHAQYGVKKSIPARMGKSIDFRRFELIDSAPSSVTALTEGTAGAAATPSISNVVATISQYGRHVELTDMLEEQAIDPMVTELTEVMGEQAGIDIDTVIRDVLVAGSSVQYASTALSRGQVGSGMFFNSAEIREALRTLRRNNARTVEDNKFIVFVHPDTWSDLLNDSDFKNFGQHAQPRDASNVLVSGDATDYLGMRFVMTSRAKVYASLGLSGADVYATVIVGNQAYGVTELDTQNLRTYYEPLGSAGAGDPLHQRSTLGFKCAFAAVRLNENFLLRVEHVTTAKQAA